MHGFRFRVCLVLDLEGMLGFRFRACLVLDLEGMLGFRFIGYAWF